MRLRVSGEHTDNDYDLGIVTGNSPTDGGIPHGALLNRFAAAVCAPNDESLAPLRAEVVGKLGPAALVDAVAVIAAFNAFPRVADATGIPLEDAKAEMTAGLREELGLDALDTAAKD